MRLKTACAAFILVSLVVGIVAFAQEGHPLTGVWYGDWGASAAKRTQITIVMAWDGKAVNGTINPGPEAGMMKATLDSTKWMVHLEGDAKDDKGTPYHFAADGKLENIGSYNRTLSGTWTQGSAKGDFKLKRDD